MLKKVLFFSICFALISGCALMDTSDVETEKQDAVAPVSNAEPGNGGSQAVVATPETSAAADHKNLRSEYIKKVQTHLKEAGFYSGGVDGIADAGTQTAVRHFQASCSTLKDLITTPDSAIQQRPPAKTAMAKNKRSAVDAVRVIQLRLKDAGFGPGPIDGIHGVKTQAALASLSSGCALLKGFSTASEATAAAGHESSPAILSETFEGASDPINRHAVKSLQARLRNAGFDPGPIDGLLGPRTRSALQKYHQSVTKISALR